ncbi:MAG: VOC family protein [Myxococcales bacterium]
MTTKNARKIFVNLPVKNLKNSMKFFSQLGFEFNPQFTDDKAACMLVSEEAFVMLLSEPFFKTFAKQRELCDTRTHTEALFALSCESRAEVDALIQKVLAAGGKTAEDPQDHGFMYGQGFYDLDGHGWEVMWMDPAAIQKH